MWMKFCLRKVISQSNRLFFEKTEYTIIRNYLEMNVYEMLNRIYFVLDSNRDVHLLIY